MPRKNRILAARRPTFGLGGIPDDCTDTAIGKHAVDRLGFQIGEIVYLRALVVDALITPGFSPTIQTLIIDRKGNKTEYSVRIEPEEVIRSPEVDGAGPS